MAKIESRKLIEIKISTVVAVSAILHGTDPALLEAAMREMTGGEPDYFDGECAVIDIGFCDLSRGSIDWPALIRLFRSYRLNPVAVRNAGADLTPEILAHGLCLDVIAKPRVSIEEKIGKPAPIAEAVQQRPQQQPAASSGSGFGTMIIDTPVRAGQRIYARGADLIVTATVNNGAELIADGSIHVYAPLRGRALAGASGHSDARIFALSMEAELVSIAGMYRTFEHGLTPDLARHPVQIRLVGDRIDVLSLQSSARAA